MNLRKQNHLRLLELGLIGARYNKLHARTMFPAQGEIIYLRGKKVYLYLKEVLVRQTKQTVRIPSASLSIIQIVFFLFIYLLVLRILMLIWRSKDLMSMAV